jgi:hypothetical protein
MQLEHAATGAGRHHDIIVGSKALNDLLGNLPRSGAITRIERRLTATGLPRNLDGAARVLEQLDRREPDRRTDKIDQTGDEQADPHGLGRLAGSWSLRLGHKNFAQGTVAFKRPGNARLLSTCWV